MVTHYEVLGVAPEATDKELKRQYQLLVVRLHPDKPAGNHTKFTRLQEAYTVLIDPHQRAEYDMQLRRDELYQQYPISEELFLEDLQPCGAGYSHVCRCGGHFSLAGSEAADTAHSELAVLCDNCSLAIIVLLPLNKMPHISAPTSALAQQTTGTVEKGFHQITPVSESTQTKLDVNVNNCKIVTSKCYEIEKMGTEEGVVRNFENIYCEKDEIEMSSGAAVGDGNSSSTCSSSDSHSPLQCLNSLVPEPTSLNKETIQIEPSCTITTNPNTCSSINANSNITLTNASI